MADQTENPLEDALIREVNDDLREEQMMKLWKAIGPYVIGTAVLIVAIVAGYQGWKQYDITTRANEGDGFYTASLLARSGKTEEAIKAFGQLSIDARSGYGTLAQFQQAALMAAQGDTIGAVALYQQIATANVGDVAMSGLANVLGSMLEINAGGYDAANLTQRLEAISGDSHPYRYSARELLGLIAMEAGDTPKAIESFKQLATDTTTPRGIRDRASNLIQYLGG